MNAPASPLHANYIAVSLIDTLWQHVKRGTCYRILGEVTVAEARFADQDPAFLNVTIAGTPGATLVAAPSGKLDIPGTVFRLMVSIQISKPLPTNKPVEFLLYQPIEGGTVYARPKNEFVDGRFQRLY